MKRTIIDLFEESVAKYGSKEFLLEKHNGKFEPTTYKESYDRAITIGAGLAAIGIERGDRVSILAEGCNNWIIFNNFFLFVVFFLFLLFLFMINCFIIFII